MRWVALTLLFMIPATSPTQKPAKGNADYNVSVFYWANDLNAMCQAENPLPEGIQLSPSTKVFLNSPEFKKILEFKTAQGECVGYILGHAEALSQIPGKVCFPLHNEGSEVADAVKEEIAKSSVLRDKQLPASIAVELALEELYPCQKQ